MTADDIRRRAGKENRPSATSAVFAFPVVVAIVFLAFHLPYLPQSLEDLDSINFALGIRHFDVAEHQPHPPGYPVFILLGKLANAIVPSEAAALSGVAIVAGTLGVLALAALFRRVSEDDASPWPLAATLVAVTSPMYWFTAERPLSDTTGLAAAVAVQAMTLSARTPRRLGAASFCAALATGIRSQVAWLTVPLLILKVIERFVGTRHHEGHRGLRGRIAFGADSSSVFVSPVVEVCLAVVAFVAGLLVWAVPLLIVTGGPAVYWKALSFQGTADLGNIQMLWTRHGARDVADALYFALIAPWATWPIAIAVLLLATGGTVALLVKDRRCLVLLVAAFGPYFIFDVLFQETFTSRYALPLVVPMAYLAVAGARLLPYRAGVAAVAAIAMFDAHVGGTSLAAYAHEKAPAFRLLDDMARDAGRGTGPPVLAMDRLQSFDFRRPIVWTGGALPAFERVLPAPPQHEWLEAVKYWNGGGTAPVWFVVDPKRTSIDLVQHANPSMYRWPLPYPVLIAGARPNEMDWYRVDRPEWYVGEGWALTPEAAGVAEADQRGLSRSPIEGWISVGKELSNRPIMIGGRNFEPELRPRLRVAVFGQVWDEFVVPPGAFLRFVRPPAVVGGPVPIPVYSSLTITASPPSRVAIEQFDVSATRAIFGFGEGWQEQEFNPRTGLRWRWLSERGELRFASPAPRLILHVEGESPRTYFSRGSHVVARAGDRVVFDDMLSSDFALDIPIPHGSEVVTLETDQVFQPAERSSRSQDRRHLGLRIFKCEVRPVAPPSPLP